MSQAIKGDNEEVEVVELDDNMVSEGDSKDQTRPLVLVRLLLALAEIEVLKQGLSSFGSSSSTSMDLGFSVDILFFFSSLSDLVWLISFSISAFFLN